MTDKPPAVWEGKGIECDRGHGLTKNHDDLIQKALEVGVKYVGKDTWQEVGKAIDDAESPEMVSEDVVWRCFHCSFETSDPNEAEAHFGSDKDAPAICVFWETMDDSERAHEYQQMTLELNGTREELRKYCDIQDDRDMWMNRSSRLESDLRHITNSKLTIQRKNDMTVEEQFENEAQCLPPSADPLQWITDLIHEEKEMEEKLQKMLTFLQGDTAQYCLKNHLQCLKDQAIALERYIQTLEARIILAKEDFDYDR